MGLARLPDWDARLADLVEGVRAVPFAWGAMDCCAFSAAAVRAVTGADLYAPWRGLYTSRAGAHRLQKRAGGLAHLVSSALGDPILPAQAWRGDLVLIDNIPCEVPDRMGLGVCLGIVAATTGPEGLRFAAMPRWRLAWRVG